MNNETIAAASRVHKVFYEGCDRCDRADLDLLEAEGLMDVTVCEDDFGQDSLEVGETMWVFNDKGKALVASINGNSKEPKADE